MILSIRLIKDYYKVQGYDPRPSLRTQKKIYHNYCLYCYLKYVEDLLMRLIAIFAFLICLIVFTSPCLGQQTATDWLNEGQRLADQGRYNEALQAYDEGIKLDPQWTDLYYHKGTAYNKLGIVDKAVEAFDMVNQINPKDGVVAYYWIGRTLSEAGRYEEAIRAYEKSTRSFNTYGEWFSGQKSICAQAWYYEGLALDAVGRSDEAQNAYSNAIKLDASLTRPVTGPITPGTGNEQSIDANPGYNDLATTNTIRGFMDSDQVDVWVPFSFEFSVTTNVDKAKIVMVVKPIGQLIGTDSLILKGASGEGREVYSEFDALKANQWNTVEVDVSGNSDVMDSIRKGHLEGVIEDDSAVQSVKLIISGTTIPYPSSGSIVGGAESG
jgi:tetratricopeptide (TPR) repeat protein